MCACSWSWIFGPDPLSFRGGKFICADEYHGDDPEDYRVDDAPSRYSHSDGHERFAESRSNLECKRWSVFQYDAHFYPLYGAKHGGNVLVDGDERDRSDEIHDHRLWRYGPRRGFHVSQRPDARRSKCQRV